MRYSQAGLKMWDTLAFDCFDFKVRPGTRATNPGLHEQSNLKSPQTTCYCNFFTLLQVQLQYTVVRQRPWNNFLLFFFLPESTFSSCAYPHKFQNFSVNLAVVFFRALKIEQKQMCQGLWDHPVNLHSFKM
jgi:hypothetical protein